MTRSKNVQQHGGPARRDHLGELFRALLDDTSGQNQTFAPSPDELLWVPLSLGGAQVKAGFIWNKDGPSLRLGFGAKAGFPLEGKQISLGVGARMLSIAKTAGLNTEFGSIVFDGAFPVPDFLSSGSVHGEIPSPLEIALTVVDTGSSEPDDRTLSLYEQMRLLGTASALPCSCCGRGCTSGRRAGENFFDRIDKHLFPMLGEPETNIIKPFPLFVRRTWARRRLTSTHGKTAC